MSELATQNLATYVYENLLLRIMTGKLKKGDVLPSRKKLAEEYNVAEITVRTAIQMLALNSMVSTSQGKGTVVTFDMQHDENSQFYWSFMSKRVGSIVDVMRATSLFFSDIMIYAALNCGPKDIARFKRLYIDYQEACGRNIVVCFSRFWTELLETLKNALVKELYQQMVQFTGLFSIIFEEKMMMDFKEWTLPYLQVFFRGMEEGDLDKLQQGLSAVFGDTEFVTYSEMYNDRLGTEEQVPFYWFISSERHNLTDSIINVILKRIEIGEYQIGDSIPSLNAIREEFQVSVKTARSALSSLEETGVVERSQGKKAVVTKREAIRIDKEKIPVRQMRNDLKNLLDARAALLLTHKTFVREALKGKRKNEGLCQQKSRLKTVTYHSPIPLFNEMILQIESPTLRHIYTQLENILIKGSYYRQTADYDYSDRVSAIMENYEKALNAYLEEDEEILVKSLYAVIRIQYDVTVDYCRRKGVLVERPIT
ncbi:DNA-binding transcriptional regulator, FadR family [Eubacterium maltosivorans]|uniref:GntR family transcriptional regulator n=1 Tax=Eubacterium maltosivorans TaxID=2041044 RepID=UPI00088076DD|nr:GntR family transcriptional regulator [Eubacterium maltosivorans]WPK80800.1 HTH-type transcriptional repressor NanR [Eubacterium maltosivorans]SDO31280.1 DNA-binding transcriptional regulator, FadR family [Eubacterium maltosivorans]